MNAIGVLFLIICTLQKCSEGQQTPLESNNGPQKIVIFGSTGMTGRCATEAAIRKGLTVRAFVRDPARLPENLRTKVEVVQGDVLNYTDVLNAVRGVDAVVVVLGTHNVLKPTTVLSDGMKLIVKAMKEANVEIVSVCLSAYLYVDTDSDQIPSMFRELNMDHKRMSDAVTASGLKYIAIYAPFISKNPGTGYVVTFENIIGKRISKDDLGDFLIDSLSQPEYYGKIVGAVSKQLEDGAGTANSTAKS